MIGYALGLAARVRDWIEQYRRSRRWSRLRALGMRIGDDVLLPDSTWIDTSHCYLISIGDHCGFGEGCLLLAHDAQMDEYLDAARLGRIVIHESSHVGARTVILPGVEIGPRTIVGAGSVVTKALPPNTVCAGNPARVICSLDDYLSKQRARLTEAATFVYDHYDIRVLTAERRDEIIAACEAGAAYIVGGRSAELRGEGGTPRTGHAFQSVPVVSTAAYSHDPS
jgi:maltose O-acetyltransferase